VAAHRFVIAVLTHFYIHVASIKASMTLQSYFTISEKDLWWWC